MISVLLFRFLWWSCNVLVFYHLTLPLKQYLHRNLEALVSLWDLEKTSLMWDNKILFRILSLDIQIYYGLLTSLNWLLFWSHLLGCDEACCVRFQLIAAKYTKNPNSKTIIIGTNHILAISKTFSTNTYILVSILAYIHFFRCCATKSLPSITASAYVIVIARDMV